MSNMSKFSFGILFLVVLVIFCGAVSAAEWNVSVGDSIQSVVNSASPGDSIIVNDNNGSAYTYTENIVINKNINLKTDTGSNVTIKAFNYSNPTLTINSEGSGSIVSGFTITGGITGVYVNSANDCTISGNSARGNGCSGMRLLNSNNNEILENIVIDNGMGIILENSMNNIISGNNNSVNIEGGGFNLYNSTDNIIDNNNVDDAIRLFNYSMDNIFFENNLGGIYISNYSANSIICENTLSDIRISNSDNTYIYKNNIIGTWATIYLYNSSADIHFNRISSNIDYELSSENGNVNATNNWWGTNNPTVSSNETANIIIMGGTVLYDPWLVLNVTAVPTNVINNATITADLTHNSNRADTSSQGHLPDGIPVNFTTNLGTITTTAYTNNGKANTTFNRGSATSGTATITATLDEQTEQTNITITSSDTLAPTVTANLPGGTYNTYQNITLTVTDNTDPDPHIYYTINGSNPTTTSTLYVGPILIENKITTLKFMAIDFTGNQSPIQTETYRLNLPVENANTTKVYATIQEAIDDPLTINGHLLYLAATLPTENIILNKKLTLTPDCEGVTLRAADPSKPVLTVTSLGSGSWIRYLWITAATNSAGIYLDSACNCKIQGNYIISNSKGIYLSNSSGNQIISNHVTNNQEGLSLFNSSNNNITSNSITDNTQGIFIPAECTELYSSFSLYNTISQNKIKNNHYGIYLLGDWSGIWAIGGMNTIDTSIISNIISENVYGVYSNSSQFNMHFNQLNDNNIADLWLEVIDGISFDAENNWWGSNQILMDYSDYSVPTIPMDIFCHGFVFEEWYDHEALWCVDPWLVLNVIATPTTTYNNSIVTADLTHNNNGVDTSSQGHLPDGIPVNFTTNLGTITTTAYTNNGKANTTFNRGSATSGTATITATLDEQTEQTNITITSSDTLAPTVTANLPGGTYNTTKSVTLTASDNLDPNPIVYYSLNNGTTWSNQVKTITLNLNQGVTNLKFYARDATGNTCSNQTLSYTIDITAPTVVANPASGTYNTTKSVTLTATDNLDPNPNIYYTTNGSTPTISSTRYTYPINVVSTTTLKFIAVDAAGNQAAVQTQNYIISTESMVINTNTGKSYSKIQDAINDPLTLNYHTIEINAGTYSENVVVNKKLIIKPASGFDVIVQALNPLLPVFRIYSSGNGTIIQGLTIKGSTNSSGIYAVSASEFSIIQNTFTDNYIGIYLSNSQNGNLTDNVFTNNTFGFAFLNSDNNLVDNNNIIGNYHGMRLGNSNYNLIQSNVIKNSNSGYGIGLEKSNYNTLIGNILSNNYNGIYIGLGGNLVGNCSNNLILNNNMTGNNNSVYIYNSTSNMVFGNNLTGNYRGVCVSSSDDVVIYNNFIANGRYGIYLGHSNNTTITENSITNTVYGINPQYSSANIHFNRITDSSSFSLVVQCNSNINATNNWWGSNNPVVSLTSPSDICIQNGTVIYNPWLVLNLTGSVIYVTKNSTSSSEITADITYNNQGEDTSSSGTIPNNLPLNFTTTLGTINTTATIKRGKATVALTSSPTSGAATVSATLDNQTVSKLFRKSFSTIQSAINDPLTVDGDIILVENGTYTENIVVNKSVYLVSEGSVNVNAVNPSQPVFAINNEGSGTVIYGFNITGATHSSAIYLNGVDNCQVIDNTISGNGLDSTGDFGYGIFMNSTTNCTVIGNILHNNLGGIDLEYSNNTLLFENNATNSIFRGVYLYQASSTIISENNLANNDCGILACYSNSILINGNDVKNNTYQGIYLHYSSGDVHFNRIVGNGEFGLLSRGGTVNATNNWWGTNNPVVSSVKPSNIYVISGSVLYNPRLVLTVTPTSYKVSQGKVYESTITTDLNHNSDNEDLSTVVYAPDGIPVTFTTDRGIITTSSYTNDGKASATLVLDSNLQSGLTNVTATLDGQSASTTVDRIAKATIIIASTAIDLSTNQTLYLTYEVPLNESVSWVSVLWKATGPELGVFQSEVNLIVNGNVVLNRTVVNANYIEYKYNYSPEVFENINFLNWLYSNTPCAVIELNNIIANNPQLQNLTDDELKVAMLALVKQVNNFTDSEMELISYHNYFTDYLVQHIVYPGDTAKKITFKDPDNGEITDLNFPGNPITRINNIIYSNGFYTYETGTDPNTNATILTAEYVGYEGVRSFAIATTRISDETLNYWVEQKNATDTNGNLLYPEGPMKAAYGTFLNSLLVIKCHDMVADVAATQYNVTWTRTTPVVISTLDDAYHTLLTGEMDHRMGMDVTGDPQNVKAFRFACSSAFSPIEYWVMSALFPSNSTNGTTYGPDPTGSVTLGLGQMLLDGGTLEMFESNGYMIIRILGNNTRVLVIDPETGLVMDILKGAEICGSYCYKNQQTEWATDLSTNLMDYGQTIMNILINGEGTIDLSQIATNIKTGIMGVIKSTVTSLQGANIFLMNSIPPNLFSTFLSLNVMGLTVNNALINKNKEAINDLEPSDEYMWIANASYVSTPAVGSKFTSWYYYGNDNNYGWVHATSKRNKDVNGLWVVQGTMTYEYNGNSYTETQYHVMMPDPLDIWQGNSHTFKFTRPSDDDSDPDIKIYYWEVGWYMPSYEYVSAV